MYSSSSTLRVKLNVNSALLALTLPSVTLCLYYSMFNPTGISTNRILCLMQLVNFSKGIFLGVSILPANGNPLYSPLHKTSEASFKANFGVLNLYNC